MAGHACGSSLRRRETAWLDSTPASGNTHRSAGTPAPAGRLGRAQDERGGLVDGPLGGVPLVVREGQRPVGGRVGVSSARASMGCGERGLGIVPGHQVEPLPQAGDLGTVLGQGPALGGPEGVVDHGVLLDGIPQPVGHLDRFHQRPGAAVHDIGHRPGLGRLHRLVAARPAWSRAQRLASPPTTAATSDSPGGDGRQRLVDQRLLGDAQLHQVAPGRPRPHLVGHQPGRIGIGPAPLGHRHPVDHAQQPAATRRRLRRRPVPGPSARWPRHRPTPRPPRPAPASAGRGRPAPVGRRAPVHRLAGTARPSSRQRLSGPALAHHPTHLAPGHRHRAEGQCPLTGSFGQVVVGLVRAALLVLEPLPPHAQPGGEVVQLLVAVGHQVGPAVVDRTQSGRLAPVIEVDGHRGPGRSSLR